MKLSAVEETEVDTVVLQWWKEEEATMERMMKLRMMRMKPGEREVLVEVKRRGKVERTKSAADGIMTTFNKTRVDRNPMDMKKILAAFDFREGDDGFGKRSIFWEEETSEAELENREETEECVKNEKR